MEPEIKELDVVTLLVDLPDKNLWSGDVGTVVHVFETIEHRPAGYIVEFYNKEADDWVLADIMDFSHVKLTHSMQGNQAKDEL